MGQYLVIRTGDLELLIREVNGAIQDGFTPIGGVAVAPDPDNGNLLYFQAVVVREQWEEEDTGEEED